MPCPDERLRVTKNQILSALSTQEQTRLLPHLHSVTLALGDIVYQSGARLNSIYFPTSCVISMLYTMENGSSVEMGLVGREGVVGVAVFLGGGSTPNQAITQVPGDAFQLNAKVLREEFSRGGALQRLLLRYTQALMTQISHTAVCNRVHSEEKRLCRWLLLSHDRISGDELPMTHEFISHMLGGRRESVSVAAGQLQSAGLIHYHRGRIRIIDRAGLEAVACECYLVAKRETDRLLNVMDVLQQGTE